MVAAGPSPGRMPTTVPSRQPTKHQNRFSGCSATANPCIRPPRTSMSEPEQPGRQLDFQYDREDDMERECRPHGRQTGAEQRAPENEADDAEGEQRKAEHEP